MFHKEYVDLHYFFQTILEEQLWGEMFFYKILSTLHFYSRARQVSEIPSLYSLYSDAS